MLHHNRKGMHVNKIEIQTLLQTLQTLFQKANGKTTHKANVVHLTKLSDTAAAFLGFRKIN